jgi:hypothetical protein
MLDAFWVVNILLFNALQGPELLPAFFSVYNHEVNMAVLPLADAHAAIIKIDFFLVTIVNRLIR